MEAVILVVIFGALVAAALILAIRSTLPPPPPDKLSYEDLWRRLHSEAKFCRFYKKQADKAKPTVGLTKTYEHRKAYGQDLAIEIINRTPEERRQVATEAIRLIVVEGYEPGQAIRQARSIS